VAEQAISGRCGHASGVANAQDHNVAPFNAVPNNIAVPRHQFAHVRSENWTTPLRGIDQTVALGTVTFSKPDSRARIEIDKIAVGALDSSRGGKGSDHRHELFGVGRWDLFTLSQFGQPLAHAFVRNYAAGRVIGFGLGIEARFVVRVRFDIEC
jgi:hypothetical protein